jgi:hypothetical protein
MELDSDRWRRRVSELILVIAILAVLAGCGDSSDEPSSATVTTASTSVPAATTEPLAPPTTARPSTGAGGGGSGIVEGDIPLRLPGPDLAVCAIWEEDLRNPPADAPASFHDTTLQRLHEGECPGY